MSEPIQIAVVGASGRMGQQLIKAVDENPSCVLSGVTEVSGHDWIGQDLGECLGAAGRGVVVSDDPLEVFARSQAVLEFTIPQATVHHAGIAAQARLVHVIGTTGMQPDDLTKIAAAARHATIVRAGNMSLGVNLLTALTKKVAAALDEDFDIEIVETHHNQKIDAPSGTALMLGEKSEDEGAFYSEHMLAVSAGLLPTITVPGTYHHLMFDEPLAVAMSIKILLLDWHRQNHEDEFRAALQTTLSQGKS